MSGNTSQDRFRVFVYYANGTYFEPEDKSYLAKEALEKAKEMAIKGKDDRGEYTKIILTDPDDICCFEWKKELDYSLKDMKMKKMKKVKCGDLIFYYDTFDQFTHVTKVKEFIPENKEYTEVVIYSEFENIIHKGSTFTTKLDRVRKKRIKYKHLKTFSKMEEMFADIGTTDSLNSKRLLDAYKEY